MTKRAVVLWTPILIPPAIWFLCLEANYVLAPFACGSDGKLNLFLVSIAGLIITAMAGLMARSSWQFVRREEPHVEGAPYRRMRWMAIAGLVFSAGFFLAIAAQLLPDIVLAGCD